jgi:hypothetical protein
MERNTDRDKGKALIKKILKRVFFLKPFPTVMIALPSFVLVFLVLGMGLTDSPISYVSYVLSAYALIITITVFPGMLKAFRNGFWNLHFIKALKQTQMGKKFFDSVVFRSEISLHQGLIMNLLYVAVKLVTGILYQSVWLIAFGIYYLLLAVMRGNLVHYVHSATAKCMKMGEDLEGEFRRYRVCGIVLVVMNQALACIVVYIVHRNQGVTYPGLLIYVMALYAFYSVIMAVINVVKFRRQGSPVLSAAKVISLTAAIVSMLSLETAMLDEFGQDNPAFRKLMTSISGGVVCTFVLGMAIYMIVRSSRYLKEISLKSNFNN